MAKNKLEDLRNHLFETLESLKDEEKPMEVDRARAIAGVAHAIIDSAKLELQFLELTGQEPGSDFLEAKKKLPAATGQIRAVSGKTGE
jgi:hypothetical protein